MTGDVDRPWVHRTEHVLRPDPARVVSRIFLPGQEAETPGESRSDVILERVVALSDAEVDETLQRLEELGAERHRDLRSTWESHFALMQHRLDNAAELTKQRRLLIGAFFTQEYALEGAALCNPSMVHHPDQSGLEPGSTRFVMTLRAVGEGHISSVELRTGTVDASARIDIDPTGTVAVLARPADTLYSRTSFRDQLREMSGDQTNADFVFDGLPEHFTRADLDLALADLHDQRLTRGAATWTIEQLERIAACTYAVEFAPDSSIPERVLMPRGPAESHGMEDVRLLRFVEPDGAVRYIGTYTAFDGRRIASQVLYTEDFRTFNVEQLSGPGSKNKGMAMFPRQIGGRYVALSRADRESNAVSLSTDFRHWEKPVTIQTPLRPWELVQLGNCGPPIETTAGWLVLTHGVGPMREYAIGAILLDLDDPTVVIGRLASPLLSPTAAERDGYVPNVVYSCGAMVHGQTLVLPYGCSDTHTRIATIDLEPLLAELCEKPSTEESA